jgi:hypothetical protein
MKSDNVLNLKNSVLYDAPMKLSQHIDFAAAVAIIAALVVLIALTYMHVVRFNSVVDDYRLSHWFSIAGSIYIAVASPIFVFLKRKFRGNYPNLVRFHMFGNLVFFILIAIHFTSQIARPAASYPELGTGVALFVAMSLQVASGFTQKFKTQKISINAKANRLIHGGLIAVFYLVIVFHVLHGLGMM